MRGLQKSNGVQHLFVAILVRASFLLLLALLNLALVPFEQEFNVAQSSVLGSDHQWRGALDVNFRVANTTLQQELCM